MKKLTTEEFIKRAREVHGDKYDYSLVEYKNTKTPIKIICPIHGLFIMTPENHIQKHGCSKCAGVYKPTTEEFIKRAKQIHGNKYDYELSKYINKKTPVKIICSKHGVFEQTPDNHINGQQGCPFCNSSKGEEKISLFLENKGFVFNETYFREHSFKECKGKRRKLPFDFYIPSKKILIEYQGIQHYKNSFGISNKRYSEYLKADEIKRKYARDNGYKLLTIPYWDYNIIEEILEENL